MEKYVEAFIELCKDVFEKMGNVKITAGKPFIVDKSKPLDGDISMAIGLSGETRGAVALTMRKDTATKLVEKLTGSAHPEMDDDVVDIAGEIINIIAGQAKQKLENEYVVQISLPLVTRGTGHQLSWPGKNPRIICVPFSVFDKDIFYFSATLETNSPY